MQNKNIKTVAFYTLGCKVNQYETNAMMQKLKEVGFEIVDFERKADIYIINTCTVTNMADKKSRQMLRRVKELSQHYILVAVGCYAQVAKQELEKIPEIDLILGINEKNDIVWYVEKAIQEKTSKKEKKIEREKENETNKITSKKSIDNKDSSSSQKSKIDIVNVSNVANQKEFLDFGNVTYTEKTRAVIKVQDGCNQFCSYCIIPYARGRIRSRKPQSVIQEITAISKQGIKEVVITGIHLASYGKDFDRRTTRI